MKTIKSTIVKKIASETSISFDESSNILGRFLYLIVSKSEHYQSVKINKFGVFKKIRTTQRIGRNPKTKESYIIPSVNKLIFNPSNKVKGKIN